MSGADPIPAGKQPVADQAAAWVARRCAGLSAEEEGRFQAWIAADPGHAAAFAELDAAWRSVSFADEPHLAQVALDRLNVRVKAKRRHRQAYALVAAGLAAAAALMLFFRPAPPPPHPAPAATFALRPDRQVLPDGSVVELNAGAEISVSYTPGRRSVELKHGEALFQVAKNPARPFVVTANNVAVTAVGTAFAVKNAPTRVGVLVTEGRVAVERTAPDSREPSSAAPVYLVAGDRLEMPLDPASNAVQSAGKVTDKELIEALAWRGKRIEFTRTTLPEAIQLFNRENAIRLAIGDSTTANLRVSGIFWVDDAESFARLLESGFGVEIQRIDDQLILRTP